MSYSAVLRRENRVEYETQDEDILNESFEIIEVPNDNEYNDLETSQEEEIFRQLDVFAEQLGEIGDEINRTFGSKIKILLDAFKVTAKNALKVLQGLAERILGEKINWGRIAALILVAVCVILKVLATGEVGFLAFFRDFIHKAALFINKILGVWISKRGGWLAVPFKGASLLGVKILQLGV